MALDRTNAKIIEILQKDARTSVSDLARTLNRAESTTRERLIGMEKRGIIKGYQAIVDPAKVGYPIHAILRADTDMRYVADLAKKLQAIPNVVSAQMTTGPKPVRIEFVADNFSELEQVVARRIAPLQLRDVEIGLTVQRLVEARPPPIRADEDRLVQAPQPLYAPAASAPVEPESTLLVERRPFQ